MSEPAVVAIALMLFGLLLVVTIAWLLHPSTRKPAAAQPTAPQRPSVRRAEGHRKREAGIVACKQGRAAEARKLLTAAVELAPYDYKAWVWLSRTEQDVQTKRTYLKRALKINPNNRLAQRELEALNRIGRETKSQNQTDVETRAGHAPLRFHSGTGDCKVGKEVVRRYKQGERDFRHTELRGVGLSKVDLRGIDLSQADLRKANLMRADLSHADLTGANLTNADLRDANLNRANLRGAHLNLANLRGADLHQANLQDALVSHHQLAMASDLDGATMPTANLRFMTGKTVSADSVRAPAKRRSADSVRTPAKTISADPVGTPAPQAIPANVRQAVLDRDDYICRYCGCRSQTMEIDHVVPVSQGGASDDTSNLVTACLNCNRTKGGRTPEEAGMEVLPVRTRKRDRR